MYRLARLELNILKKLISTIDNAMLIMRSCITLFKLLWVKIQYTTTINPYPANVENMVNS